MARPYAPESRIRRACASPRSKQAACACTAEDVVSIPEIQRLESDRVSLRDIIQYTQPEPERKDALLTDGHDKDNHMHIATPLPGARQAKINTFQSKGVQQSQANQLDALSVSSTAGPSLKSAYFSTISSSRGKRSPAPLSAVLARTPAKQEARTTDHLSQAQVRAGEKSRMLRKEAERGNSWKVLELLQGGVLASSTDENGRTACHYAAMNNHKQTIVVLCNPNQNAYPPHRCEDRAQDGSTALHYAAYKGCVEAALTILKMHRAQIQTDRLAKRDVNAARLQENRSQLHQIHSQILAIQKQTEELQEREFELTKRVDSVRERILEKDLIFTQERSRLRLQQKNAEDSLKAEEDRVAKLEQTVAHWKPISRVKHAMFNTELEEAVNQFAEHQKCLLVAEDALKSLEKMHGTQRRKLARQLLSDHKALTGTVPQADQNLIQQIQEKIRLVFHDLDENESGFLDCEEIKEGLHKFGLIIPDDQLGILLNAVGATGNDNGDALADDSSSVCVDVTQFEKLLAVIEEVKEEENKIDRNHENVQESSCVKDALEKNRVSREQLSEQYEHLLEENKALEAYVTDFSRKVVHVCTGPHHVDFNAEIHARAKDGSTPLHWAVDSGQDDMCHLLLVNGANANAADAQGLTALHWCAMGSPHDRSMHWLRPRKMYLDVAFELMARGANVNAVDLLGNSPLHYAAASGFQALIAALKEWGGDSSLQNSSGTNPVHYAMANAHLDCAFALVAGITDIYAALHVQDDYGMSPLHYANANGHEMLAARLAVHCNTQQLGQSHEALRLAGMGMRDASHKQLSELVGAHVMMGSSNEHVRYYMSSHLKPSRKTGWMRNDLVHQFGDSASGPVSKRNILKGDLFDSLSSPLRRIAVGDDQDMIDVSVARSDTLPAILKPLNGCRGMN